MLGPSRGAEAPRNLHVHLGHAQGPLRPVVSEEHGQVGLEPQASLPLQPQGPSHIVAAVPPTGRRGQALVVIQDRLQEGVLGRDRFLADGPAVRLLPSSTISSRLRSRWALQRAGRSRPPWYSSRRRSGCARPCRTSPRAPGGSRRPSRAARAWPPPPAGRSRHGTGPATSAGKAARVRVPQPGQQTAYARCSVTSRGGGAGRSCTWHCAGQWRSTRSAATWRRQRGRGGAAGPSSEDGWPLLLLCRPNQLTPQLRILLPQCRQLARQGLHQHHQPRHDRMADQRPRVPNARRKTGRT